MFFYECWGDIGAYLIPVHGRGVLLRVPSAPRIIGPRVVLGSSVPFGIVVTVVLVSLKRVRRLKELIEGRCGPRLLGQAGPRHEPRPSVRRLGPLRAPSPRRERGPHVLLLRVHLVRVRVAHVVSRSAMLLLLEAAAVVAVAAQLLGVVGPETIIVGIVSAVVVVVVGEVLLLRIVLLRSRVRVPVHAIGRPACRWRASILESVHCVVLGRGPGLLAQHGPGRVVGVVRRGRAVLEGPVPFGILRVAGSHLSSAVVTPTPRPFIPSLARSIPPLSQSPCSLVSSRTLHHSRRSLGRHTHTLGHIV